MSWPDGYPDETFHEAFLRDAVSTTGQAMVLTGPPGRGKSTYLSALCDALAEQGIPTVRHHYFLSVTERGRDRVNSYAVVQSIEDQVKRFHPDVSFGGGDLRSILEACATYYKDLGKPFVVVLDGLDHVWRDNAEDKRPLDDLFSQVIPCPENMVLLVGTQPVDDAQLPTDLLAYVPKEEWRTLPAMSENAVLSHLRKVYQEGRLATGFDDEHEIERQLQEAASALRTKTNGHPLHVIYAVAELEHAGGMLSKSDVDQLKGDLGRDARFYYASLWERLPPSLKDTLRLVCAFPFFWPKTAFVEIARRVGSAEPDVPKVGHLLHSSPAGLKVFHESLAVFVRSTTDYMLRITELMPIVASWLESDAPNSLRVNWLWTVQARLGAPQNLISGLTRDWIMSRLEEGYPESLFDMLLSDALIAALTTKQFAESYRLAHLKDRMVGGSQYQMQGDDIARLISYTLALTGEESVVREAVASRHEADVLHLAALGLALQTRGDPVQAEICAEEAFRRFRGLSRFSNRYSSTSGADEFKFLVDMFARLGIIGATADSLARLVTENTPIVWLPRVQLLVEKANLDELMQVAALLPDNHSKDLVSDACVRAAAGAGASILERTDFHCLSKTPLVATLEVAWTRTASLLIKPIPIKWLSGEYYEHKDNLARLVHHWFFSSVHLGLSMLAAGATAFEFIPALVFKDRTNITAFLSELALVADEIAQLWWEGQFVDFHELYKRLETVEFKFLKQDYHETAAAEDFRRALHQVACDIRTVSVLLDGSGINVSLTHSTLTEASRCAWFESGSFRTDYAAGLLTTMDADAAAAFVQDQRQVLDAEVRHETSVHLQTPLELCAIALRHGVISSARELCKQTWELTTGYAHRKDPTLNNTLDAIRYLADVAQDDARRLLSLVAPQVHHVLDYTDGKGTRHVLSSADRLLAKLQPSALVIKYEEHIHAGDWSLAEDSLKEYIMEGIRNSWPLDAVLRTGLHPEISQAIKQLDQEGITTAVERLTVLEQHAGWDLGSLMRPEMVGSKTESKPYTDDFTKYEPARLDDLLDSLSSSYHEQERVLRAWYQHWEKAGQGQQLLIALDDLLLSDEGRRRGVFALSDLAFETRRKLSGLNSAWKYLVQAHIRNGAWSGFVEPEERTLSRLELVARRYPRRCDDFVAETTYSMFGNPETSRVAPSELMVYFYARQNRIAEAVAFAEMMVNCVIDDTRTLPLEPPRWASALTTSTSVEH